MLRHRYNKSDVIKQLEDKGIAPPPSMTYEGMTIGALKKHARTHKVTLAPSSSSAGTSRKKIPRCLWLLLLLLVAVGYAVFATLFWRDDDLTFADAQSATRAADARSSWETATAQAIIVESTRTQEALSRSLTAQAEGLNATSTALVPTNTPIPTSTPTPTSTSTPTVTPTATFTPTSTDTPTVTPTETSIPTPVTVRIHHR